MPRFYVTMTWEDWPDSASYGGVFTAENENSAIELCKREMAEKMGEDQHEDPANILKWWRDDWHCVDCWEVNALVEMLTRDGQKPPS